MRLRSLVSDSALYGLGSIAASLVGVVLLPLYGHYLDPIEFGDAELALRIVLAAAIVARLGLVNAFFRFVFDAEEGDEAARRRVLRTAFWALQATTLAAAAIAILVAPVVGPRVFASPDPVATRIVLIVALGIYLQVNYDLMSALYRVQRRPIAFSLRTLATVLVNAALSFLFLVGLGLGADGTLLGSYLGIAVVYVGMLVEQRRWLGRGLDRALLREMLAFGMPLMPAGAALWLVTLVNRPLIAAISGAAALGLFAVAFRVAQAVLLAVNAFQMAWPAFAYGIRDDDQARRTYARVLALYVAVMGGIALAVALVGPWLVRALVAEEYWAAAPAVLPLAAGAPLYGAYYVAAVGLGRMKRNRFNWVVVLVAVVVEVAAILALGPHFGIVGAGWAIAIAYAVMLVLIVWRAQSIFPVPYDVGRIARAVALLAVGFVLAWRLPDDGSGPLAARLGVLLGFAAGLFAVGFFSREERASMRRAVRRLRTSSDAPGSVS